MKKPDLFIPSLFILFLLVSNLLVAQWPVWSDPVSITDSVSDNINPNIRLLQFTSYDFYIFWEKSTDTLSSAIYYKNFYEDDEPQVFVGDDGVHYSNPQPVDTWHGQWDDTLFYVFYESDIEGFDNIYYRVYNSSGFTEPTPLTETTNEKTELLCNNSGRIVWMEQNRIMHSKLDEYTHVFEEPFVIDSGNCSFPSIVQTDIEWSGDIPVVSWIKVLNDSSHIMIRRQDKKDGWLDAETIFTGDSCTNLSFCTGMGQSGILTWDYFNDTSWHFLYYDLEDDQVYISENSQQKPFQPRYYSGAVFVKSKEFGPGYTTYVYQNNDTIDIYTSGFYSFNPPVYLYQNISKSDNPVKHPQIFTGKVESPCNYYSINIWEEKENDHWQLKYSTAFICLSDIEEKNEPEQVQLITTPNPFCGEVEISFLLNRSDDVTLSVYNTAGVKIKTIEQGKLGAGQHIYKWNGSKYPAGLYFVQLQSVSGLTTQKMILTK